MIAFIDDHRCVHGVGPICRVLGIAPSTFYAFKAVERDPDLASDRARQDRLDLVAIKEAFDGSRGRYGARKVWHQLRREGHDIARCTVERLMKVMELQGVVRGKKAITTNPDTAQPCPDDKVNRAFVADMPNQLWVSDFTYVSSWQGMVYVAFIIDVFARRDRRLAGKPHSSMTTGFVLDALEPGHLASAQPSRGRQARSTIPTAAGKADSIGRRNTFNMPGSSSSSRASAGVLQSRVLRGRLLRAPRLREFIRAMDTEICSLWEVLSQKTVSVLVATALPRTLGIAEVNREPGLHA